MILRDHSSRHRPYPHCVFADWHGQINGTAPDLYETSANLYETGRVAVALSSMRYADWHGQINGYERH